MNDLKFATFRLGKTSVGDIQNLGKRPSGVQPDDYSFVVTCTQVPDELSVGTVVFIWLGSDNSKGTPTEWKQGFKGVGVVASLTKGAKYNDESQTTIQLKYIFDVSVNRLDILRENPAAYYWCSELPIIGLDDHSNQTARMLLETGDRSRIGAFLSALNSVCSTFRADVESVIPGIGEWFWAQVPEPKELSVVIRDADNRSVDELATELRLMNDDPNTGAASYRVLGLKYPTSLDKAGIIPVLQKAGLSDTYQTEINKGRKLHELIKLGKWGMAFASYSRMDSSRFSDVPLQLISYGAPGTGKSHKISAVANENNSIRVTFHPDTDYSAFIGAYKPTMVDVRRTYVNEGVEKDVVDGDGNPVVEKKIVYSFVPQAFMKAYVEAWRRWCDGNMPDGDKVFYLVIEEINRGNCAQIFGDAFQLLDRCANGFSSYAIAPDHDVERFLREDKDWNLSELVLTEDVTNDERRVVATADQIKSGKRMVLPPNLRIWATMNTSDQSLFPMDSAFKRRWDWEYAPIKDEGKGWYVKIGEDKYKWWSFLEKINPIVNTETESADKKMGYFFVKLPEGQKEISVETFVNKVAFYLWNDVFKDCEIREDALKLLDTNGKPGEPIKFTDFFKPHSSSVEEKVVKDLMDALKVEKESSGSDGQAAD